METPQPLRARALKRLPPMHGYSPKHGSYGNSGTSLSAVQQTALGSNSGTAGTKPSLRPTAAKPQRVPPFWKKAVDASALFLIKSGNAMPLRSSENAAGDVARFTVVGWEREGCVLGMRVAGQRAVWDVMRYWSTTRSRHPYALRPLCKVASSENAS
jgi:hypothetical protein